MEKEAELYPALERQYHDAESEQRINEFWTKHDTFHKSIERRDGAPAWVFYEGPPTANGIPGVHHVMARLSKDIMCRFKTMSGYRVVRKAGWDTHGLPVERSVEKTIGIQGAQAIKDFGIAPFNDKCRESVWSCKADWDEFTSRIGYWVDLDNPYITYTNEYIETVWWILRQFHDKDLLYRGHKVVPYCPICATPLSSHEMANSYRTVSDPSIFVKLKATDADEFFVTWTTTPWTLPSNVALAVGSEFDYVRVRYGNDILILAEARLSVLESWSDDEVEIEVIEKFKGQELLGRHYEQLLPFVSPGGKRAFEVVAADFVTLDSGSGIVHMAPAFGEDDFQIGKAEDLAFFKPVDANGEFTDEVTPWAGMHVKKADPQIIKHLQAEGKLLGTATYTHEYPYHDRCNNPLIYYATPSWFIRTSSMREQLVEANRQITWAPPEMGSRRFGNWLAGNIDWSLSRNRFWGTPLNVWVCDTCGEMHLPTCRDDLSKLTGQDQTELDLHRPHVDSITFACTGQDCSGTMHRTPEVIDCWFDAGSMPFAQYHYPFENKELFESQFPADFISEGVDQTRGWFYTMLVISTFLFGRSSYKSCLVNELILDRKGKKMSKSLGNAVAPMEILHTAGADPLRWYMITCSPVWMPTRFDHEGIKEAQRKLLATIDNTYKFFALYANLDQYRADTGGETAPNLLDRWIISRLQSISASVKKDLDALNLTRAGKTLGDFFTNDVSNWYVRLSRRRFWQGEMTVDKRTAFFTLFTVLESSQRLLAPFIPFTAEKIYRNLFAHQDTDASVHLTDFPVCDQSLQDVELERKMATAQAVVGLGRSLRMEASLRTRQPLGNLLMHANDDRARALVDDQQLVDYVSGELNVKSVALVEDPREVAQLSAKPNFRALGPRFGKKAPLAAKRISAMVSAEIMALRTDGQVTLDLEGEPTGFGFDEIAVLEQGIDPFIAGGEAGLTVALDTTLTDDLRLEGLCREIINKVQNLRKKSGLEVSDRIQLTVGGPDRVQEVLAGYGDRIAAETLAAEMGSFSELPFQDNFVIDDIEIDIAIGKY